MLVQLSMIETYTGDCTKLGTPEQFYLALVDFKQFPVYVNTLLNVQEFGTSYSSLEPQLDR